MANGLAAPPPAQPVATASYNLMQVPPANQMPADETIVAAISSILDSTDLGTVTMKQVRDELTRIFGIDMTARREFINQTVQSMIQRRN
ncbi:hypothetical protein LPJ56_006605 [Coemansia sp. RSA 2599]|nr:hypothetical protein LPJ56_006605 [Coemansia sp. RSA 2599]